MPLDNDGQPFDFISITTLEATSEPLFLSPWRHFDVGDDTFSALDCDAPDQYGAIGDSPPLYLRAQKSSDMHPANHALVMDWPEHPESEDGGVLLRSGTGTPNTFISMDSDMRTSCTTSEPATDIFNDRLEEDCVNFGLQEPTLFLITSGGDRKRRVYRSEGTDFFQTHPTFEALSQVFDKLRQPQSCQTWEPVPIRTGNILFPYNSHAVDDSSSDDPWWCECNSPGNSDTSIWTTALKELGMRSYSSHY